MDCDIAKIEEYYKKYSTDINQWLPEGIIEVDLTLLQNFGLLNYHSIEKDYQSLTRYFHLLEAPEKITLVNEQFVVWIIPEKVGNKAITYTLIAINHPEYPRLETAFSTSGIYNSSRLVLRVLEKYLHEIQETEDEIKYLSKKSRQS